MKSLSELYDVMLQTALSVTNIAPLVKSKNRFNDEEKDKIVQLAQSIVDAAQVMVDEVNRRRKNEKDEIAVQFTIPTEISYTVVEYGRAFRGNPNDVVKVPVTMEPVLYLSKSNRHSWRTMVAGAPGFRHINVANFYAKAKDNYGNWYAVVDRTWPTDQPVFKDYCNRDGHIAPSE